MALAVPATNALPKEQRAVECPDIVSTFNASKNTFFGVLTSSRICDAPTSAPDRQPKVCHQFRVLRTVRGQVNDSSVYQAAPETHGLIMFVYFHLGATFLVMDHPERPGAISSCSTVKMPPDRSSAVIDRIERETGVSLSLDNMGDGTP